MKNKNHYQTCGKFITRMIGYDNIISNPVEMDFLSARKIMWSQPVVKEIEILNFEAGEWELYFFRDEDTDKPVCVFEIDYLCGSHS